MLVTQKCQYALRALVVLARRQGRGPIKIAQIAERQSIPFRFLEVILSQLKQGGFVESRRGTEGGYLLARPAESITMAEIVRFIDGQLQPVEAEASNGGALEGVLESIWQEATEALEHVLAEITIADLVAREEKATKEFVPNFEI